MIGINFSKFIFLLLNLILLFFLSSCKREPEPINYDKDECEFCRMLITDNRYGAEIVTDKGKVYKFDSIECLADFALQKNMIGDENQTLLVTDFSVPEKFINCKTASYVHNENFRSPMGLNVSAFNNESSADNFISENGGDKLTWPEVIEMVKHSGMSH